MERKLILRGLLAGAIAGVLAFVFARIFAEPQIQAAIDYESSRDAAEHALETAAGSTMAEVHSDIFSRTLQANLGLGVGIIGLGAAMGVLFAIVYSVCLGRVGNLRPRSLSLLVAAGGFLGFYLVPFIKYPANPPSIGHSETIGARGGLYLVMVFGSILLLVVATVLGQRLKARFGSWNAALLASAGFVVVIGILMAILPSFGHLQFNLDHYGNFATETPQPLTDAKGNLVFPGFPADTLFNFRAYSVAAQLILWTAIGLIFAPLADRLLRPNTPIAGADREAARI